MLKWQISPHLSDMSCSKHIRLDSVTIFSSSYSQDVLLNPDLLSVIFPNLKLSDLTKIKKVNKIFAKAVKPIESIYLDLLNTSLADENGGNLNISWLKFVDQNKKLSELLSNISLHQKKN